jgi:hypothetical protein
MKYPLFTHYAQPCQKDSLKEYQGLYGFIKDCPSLSRIGNREKETRVRNGVMKSVKNLSPSNRIIITRPRPPIASTAPGRISLIILLMNCEVTTAPHYLRKLGLTQPLLSQYPL